MSIPSKEELIDAIMELDDDTIGPLDDAMEYFCGNYWKAHGYREGLVAEINDQLYNHPEDVLPEEIKTLLTHLKIPMCPRCILPWKEENKARLGDVKISQCKECGVCKECEHLQECSKSN